MILYAFKPHTVETAPAWEGAPLRAWRWAINVERWAIELEEQVRFGEADTWGPAIHYVGAYLAGPAQVGFYHFYNDGPHHSLWLGFLNICWSLGACDVCMPPAEEDTSGAVQDFVEDLLTMAVGLAVLRAKRSAGGAS